MEILLTKGIRNSYLETMFSCDDFKAISLNGKRDGKKVAFRNIVKKNFENVVVDITKVVLSSYGDNWSIYKDKQNRIQYLPSKLKNKN
jgi:hypothetical protein